MIGRSLFCRILRRRAFKATKSFFSISILFGASWEGGQKAISVLEGGAVWQSRSYLYELTRIYEYLRKNTRILLVFLWFIRIFCDLGHILLVVSCLNIYALFKKITNFVNTSKIRAKIRVNSQKYEFTRIFARILLIFTKLSYFF